jgi:hypothetical protein
MLRGMFIDPLIAVFTLGFVAMCAFGFGYIKGLDAGYARPHPPAPGARRTANAKAESRRPGAADANPAGVGPSPEPTLEQLRRMLEPDWDPTLQWDGTPALTSELTIHTPSRPSSD